MTKGAEITKVDSKIIKGLKRHFSRSDPKCTKVLYMFLYTSWDPNYRYKQVLLSD
jgi:hypothetical protein